MYNILEHFNIPVVLIKQKVTFLAIHNESSLYELASLNDCTCMHTELVSVEISSNMKIFVVGKLGDKGDEEKKDEEGAGEEDPEIAEARREAEEKRKEKHRKMEEEREGMRQSIRDKVSRTI